MDVGELDSDGAGGLAGSSAELRLVDDEVRFRRKGSFRLGRRKTGKCNPAGKGRESLAAWESPNMMEALNLEIWFKWESRQRVNASFDT